MASIRRARPADGAPKKEEDRYTGRNLAFPLRRGHLFPNCRVRAGVGFCSLRRGSVERDAIDRRSTTD